MVSQKFVTLSALVLVFAVMATNAGKIKDANKASNTEKEMEMAIVALCGQYSEIISTQYSFNI
jgi:hypothetical protein